MSQTMLNFSDQTIPVVNGVNTSINRVEKFVHVPMFGKARFISKHICR